MSIFKDKTLMITGGTGSFGNAVLKRFLRTDIGEIRIFSRDEKKQDDMRHEYQAKYPDVAHKIKFYIGDVRSLESCRSAMPGTDYIFHAAALKQVPSCEFFPMEAVRTNVIGTDNVLTAAIESGVRRRWPWPKAATAERRKSAAPVTETSCAPVVPSSLSGLTRFGMEIPSH